MAAFAKGYYLSPSALNVYRDCPRCFWLDKNRKIKRPRGPFPTLPSGMDRVIKTYFDEFRAKNELPPELRVPAFRNIRLYDEQTKLDLWREWRTGLRIELPGGHVLSGALDELAMQGKLFIPFDYKTKGRPVKPEEAVKYYQHQLDCYAWMLEENGMPQSGYSFLLYFSPKKALDQGKFQFHVQAIKLNTDTGRARKTVEDALASLAGPLPKSSPGCEYCQWALRYAGTQD